jgi:hypothetical protein
MGRLKICRIWLSPDDFVLIALGDSKKIKSPLEKAVGYTAPTLILPPNADWDVVGAAASSTVRI